MVTTKDISQTSDGYHTFAELYQHRHALFAMVCVLANWGDGDRKLKGFKSWVHDDGSSFGEDWFIAGLELPGEGFITYHLPAEYWTRTNLPQATRAPKWDGHTPNDVVERMTRWVEAHKPASARG